MFREAAGPLANRKGPPTMLTLAHVSDSHGAQHAIEHLVAGPVGIALLALAVAVVLVARARADR